MSSFIIGDRYALPSGLEHFTVTLEPQPHKSLTCAVYKMVKGGEPFVLDVMRKGYFKHQLRYVEYLATTYPAWSFEVRTTEDGYGRVTKLHCTPKPSAEEEDAEGM